MTVATTLVSPSHHLDLTASIGPDGMLGPSGYWIELRSPFSHTLKPSSIVLIIHYVISDMKTKHCTHTSK